MVTWGGGGYIRYGLQFGRGGDVGAKFEGGANGVVQWDENYDQ